MKMHKMKINIDLLRKRNNNNNITLWQFLPVNM